MRALITILLLCACAACHTAPPKTADGLRAHAHGMNLLLIVLDAANASHFSYAGYARETTPNIDRIALEGVIFDECYAQASATPLSMYSLLTSRYPILGAEDYAPGGELAAVIPAAMPTFASRATEGFAARGAFVANRWLSEELGFDHGWSTFEKVYDQVDPNQLVGANRVTDSFTGWLDRDPDGPWLGWLHYLEPHEPYTPPEPWLSRFMTGHPGPTDGTVGRLRRWRTTVPPDSVRQNTIDLYDGNLAWADFEVGRVVEDLKRRGEWEHTVVVITSDHGEAFWEHGVRGHGLHVFEEFVRVPLVIRVPGLAPRTVPGAVELVDVVPTLLDLASIQSPPGSLAGQSLVAMMVGEATSGDLAFSRNHQSGFLEIGVRRGPLKYHALLQQKKVALYNLDADPAELENLIPEDEPLTGDIRTLAIGMQELVDAWIEGRSGTGDDHDPSLAGADSLDAATIEALRSIGYFGN